MRLLSRLDRPRRLALTGGVALMVAGALVAIFAPGPSATVPSAPNGAGDAPLLRYVRSLPDAGDPALVRPVGLAVGDGRVYVADSGASVVRVFSTAGFDLGEIGRDVLRVPAYLASDEETDTLLVVDRELQSVLRFDREGQRLADLVPSIETSVPWEPLGIAVDGEGSVAVTDSSGRHRVLLMDRNGRTRMLIGQAGASTGGVGVALDFPNSVAFSEDRIWVSDSNNRRILVFDRQGSFEQLVRVNGVSRGLAFLHNDRDEKTYVAAVDALASEIVLLESGAGEVTRYGGPGGSAGQLAYPNDVAYDASTSQLFVADTGNARVQVWEVTWPSDRRGLRGAIEQLPFSPMQLFGLVVALVGAVTIAVAVWPQRRSAEKLL